MPLLHSLRTKPCYPTRATELGQSESNSSANALAIPTTTRPMRMPTARSTRTGCCSRPGAAKIPAASDCVTEQGTIEQVGMLKTGLDAVYLLANQINLIRSLRFETAKNISERKIHFPWLAPRGLANSTIVARCLSKG